MAPSGVTANLLREVERIRPLLTDNAKSAEANRQMGKAKSRVEALDALTPFLHRAIAPGPRDDATDGRASV